MIIFIFIPRLISNFIVIQRLPIEEYYLFMTMFEIMKNLEKRLMMAYLLIERIKRNPRVDLQAQVEK